MAAVAATNAAGEVVAAKTCAKYIDSKTFIEFLNALHGQRRPCYLFLDNLNLHKMEEVKEAAKICKIELIYNAIYCSELNPVEYLWKLSKDAFRRDLIQEADYRN